MPLKASYNNTIIALECENIITPKCKKVKYMMLKSTDLKKNSGSTGKNDANRNKRRKNGVAAGNKKEPSEPFSRFNVYNLCGMVDYLLYL